MRRRARNGKVDGRAVKLAIIFVLVVHAEVRGADGGVRRVREQRVASRRGHRVTSTRGGASKEGRRLLTRKRRARAAQGLHLSRGHGFSQFHSLTALIQKVGVVHGRVALCAETFMFFAREELLVAARQDVHLREVQGRVRV